MLYVFVHRVKVLMRSRGRENGILVSHFHRCNIILDSFCNDLIVLCSVYKKNKGLVKH